MAGRKGKRTGHELPKEIYVSVSGSPGKPFFSVHASFDHIGKDTVLGVYKLKRTSLLKVTRQLKKME